MWNSWKPRWRISDSWMRNFSGDFDVNMMAIQDEKTDRYTLTKYQVRYDIHRNRPGYSTLDAVYVYDKRNESLMMIPDDCCHFEPLVYDFGMRAAGRVKAGL